MIARRLQPLLRQWREQRRLRLAAMMVALLLGLHLVLAVSDRRQAIQTTWRQDAQLYGRLVSASRDDQWPERLEQVRASRIALEASLPRSDSEGLAQAELQAWLSQQAQSAGIAAPRVQAQQAIAVPGRDELWQVIARLDAQVEPDALARLLNALAQARPWTQVERLDVRPGRGLRQLTLVVRAYSLRPADAGTPTP